MTNQEFYNLLDQAGHRLGSLAKNSPGYAFELRKLIEIVEGNLVKDFLHKFNLSGLGNAEMIQPEDVRFALLKHMENRNAN